MKKLIGILAILLVAFMVAVLWSETVFDGYVKYIETHPIIVSVPVVQVVEITPPPVIKAVELTRQLREYASTEEFQDWLNNNTAWLLTFDASGTVHLISLVDAKSCVDHATRLQELAYKDGYYLSCQVVLDGLLMGRKVTSIMGTHMGVLAIIGGDVYYADPYPGSTVTCVGHKG